MATGGTLVLGVAVSNATGAPLTGRAVVWSSLQPAIASVSASGMVTALAYAGPGNREAHIIAASEGKADTALIIVTPVPIAAIAVASTTMTLVEGESTQLTAAVRDSTGGALSGRSLVWSSSDSAVATVSSTGVVSATPYAGDVISRAVTISASSEGKRGTAVLIVTVDFNRSSTFYALVANGFPNLASYYPPMRNASAISNVVADLNRDGRDDIVLHLWGRGDLNVSDAPVPNRLVALVAQPDGRYIDRTAQLFGSTDVDLAGAATRKVRVADLNGDGYPDWVYATNKEDGRPFEAPNFHGAQSAAAVSNGDGTWRIVIFGPKQFHHSVELLRAASGDWHVLVGGIGGAATPESYRFNGGSFIPVSGYPLLSQGTYAAYSSDNNPIPNQLLTAYSTNWTQPDGVKIYTRSGASWQDAGSFYWSSWRNITGPGFGYPSWSVTWDGQDYIQGGWFESCGLRLTPNGERVAIAHYATSIVPGAVAGSSTLNASQMITYSHLFAFRPGGSALQVVNAFHEPKGPYNSNDVRCLDINGDGFEDVVTAPYRTGARPRVHLNTQSGMLAVLPDARFPEGPTGLSWTSLFADSNGDGIKDLVYFPGNGCNGGPSCTMQLYRGRRQLR